MLYTNVEAMVAPEKWALLQQKYTDVNKKDLPIGLMSSHLVQDQGDPQRWRIVTFWQSRKDLEEYKKSVQTPAWILVFRAAGAEPKLSIFEVIISK